MTAGAPRRPDRAGLVIAVLLALLAGVIFWQTRAMPVTAQYARVGPTTFPYVVAAGLALLAAGTAVSAWRGGFPQREADRVGVQIMEKAGFDVRAMPVFMERLQRATRVYENNAPAYLQTHPINTERIADLQNRTETIAYKQIPEKYRSASLENAVELSPGAPAVVEPK